jgi:mannitol 2-dehydrogenase
MSCDNIQGNGSVAETAVTAFARRKDSALGEWIATQVAFPNSMVDRITPVTTDAAVAEVRARYDIEDAWPVVAESYEQWVLEDRFSMGRPDLGSVGVQLVPDVLPYELMKLRLLNASHQAMSYLGILAGYGTVHDVCRTAVFADFLRGYMTDEAMPTLDPVPGVDLVQYREQLITRFCSAAITDTLARQVVDGSHRIPKFLLPVLRAQLEADGPIEHIALVVAAWSRYLEGADERGRAVTPVDDRADLIVAAAKREATEPGAFLRLADIFGDLGGNARFVSAFLAARHQLIEHGAQAAVARLTERSAA